MVMNMRMWLIAAAAVLVLAPVSGFAQQMTPQDMMMHGTPLEGTVTQVRYVSCGAGSASCQGIFDVTPASEGTMMQQGAMSGEHMMVHPVTIIVVPGSTLMYQGAALPLTRLHVGDMVKLEYQTIDSMNVAVSLIMTGMGHMGHM